MATKTAAPPPTLRQFRIARWYIGGAIMLVNTLVLFVLLNVAIWLLLAFHHRNDKPSYLTYSDAWYRKVYAPMSDPDWKELLKESKTRPFNSQPYVMFTEPPFHGRYINVSADGYRVVPQQGPWPMDPKNYNVLAFGNSTMFGYSVADDQTVPAYMQAILQEASGRRVCVYNFGRRAYHSTQERILFEQLLQAGIKPNLVVFMDGLNDFLGIDPAFQPQHQDESLAPLSRGAHLLQVLQSLPVGELTQLLSRKLMPKKSPPLPDCKAADLTAIDQYVWNKRAIESVASAQGIAAIFVWQPAPIFEYDLTYHERTIKDYNLYGDQCAVQGYPLMASHVKNNNMGNDFLWLADMQVGIHKSLYVDKWHYTPDFAKDVAGDICKFAEQRKDIPAR